MDSGRCYTLICDEPHYFGGAVLNPENSSIANISRVSTVSLTA